MPDAGRTPPRLLSRALMCSAGLLIVLWLGSVKVEFTPYDNGWDKVTVFSGALIVVGVDPEWQQAFGPQPRGPVFEWQSTWHMAWWWDLVATRHKDTNVASNWAWVFPLWPTVVLTGSLALLARRRTHKGKEP